jgi:glycosyltransferase involved in cell wall biosynthesis
MFYISAGHFFQAVNKSAPEVIMKILMINKFLYPKGGDAIVALETGKLLSGKKHRVAFWGMDHPRNPEYRYSGDFVPFVDFNAKHNVVKQLNIVLNIFYSFPARERLRKVVRDFKPDIAHLHNISHQISPSIIDLLKAYDIPCVMTMHDYKLVCPSYGLLSRKKICERCKGRKYYHCFLQGCVKASKMKSLVNTVEMYLHHHVTRSYENVGRFISPSRFMKAKLEEMGFKRDIDYLPNFIKLKRYVPRYESGEDSIVYFGRLSHEKGLYTLIGAMKKIAGFYLKIIGEGPLKEELKKKVETEDIRNVRFLDYMKGPALHEEIRKSVCSVLTSECYENNPLSVIESFALGKPVIGSDIGGIPELVRDNETGLTFEPGNMENLRSRIEYMKNNPAETIHMGTRARKFVEEEFNAGRHYKRLMEIYRKAKVDI